MTEAASEGHVSVLAMVADPRHRLRARRYTASHDDRYGDHSIALCAAVFLAGGPCLAMAEIDFRSTAPNWAGAERVLAKHPADCVAQLVEAATLCVAEAERLLRADASTTTAV